eukprot:gnl/MRDRNA2_/MRDRNA2_147812_c0_seq1.p1 gnl/MRDRNA2_/MRDRNA2_147812_c0~~gnl/MRDRNA2_/MRDRNA2_147812_c0_seq1.p1  ORF type:complete len:448 (-),score=95.31 gnl/MRDRNA2_/MRDRNA2_147812_c0_seq1:199-1542(-)
MHQVIPFVFIVQTQGNWLSAKHADALQSTFVHPVVNRATKMASNDYQDLNAVTLGKPAWHMRVGMPMKMNLPIQQERYRQHLPQRFTVFHAGANEDAQMSELDRLRRSVENAKARLKDEATGEAQDALVAAEAALSAYELSNPSASLASIISAKQSEVSARGRSYEEEKEAWQLEKLGEEATQCAQAEAILTEVAEIAASNESTTSGDTLPWPGEQQARRRRTAETAANVIPWQRIARSIGELGYWVMRGSQRAELSLLRQLTEHEGSWIAQETDAVLRKVWSTSGKAEVVMALDNARASLVAGDAAKALSIYDNLCTELTPDWPEAWHQRGLCLHRALRQPEQAEESLEKALRLNPRRYPTLLALARLLLIEPRSKVTLDIDAAIEAMAAEDLAPRGSGAANATGSARKLLLTQRRERARELLKEAACLNPILRPEVESILKQHDL